MGALQKVLIVDDGRRRGGRTLSAELAELGYASVTAAFEATDDVLAAIGTPAAILLDMTGSGRAEQAAFAALAERLRGCALGAGIPIIEVDARRAGAPINLGGRIGAGIVSEPER